MASRSGQKETFKDILLNQDGFISDFSNSHELGALTATPEPGILLRLGSTFAGLAAYARRKRTRGATAGLS